jgi:hypothetical protein
MTTGEITVDALSIAVKKPTIGQQRLELLHSTNASTVIESQSSISAQNKVYYLTGEDVKLLMGTEANFEFAGFYKTATGERVMVKYIPQQKEWWVKLHIRHTIRLYGSILLVLFGIVDLLLNIFSIGYWDIISDIVWIIGSIGILGASTYMAIDSNGD